MGHKQEDIFHNIIQSCNCIKLHDKPQLGYMIILKTKDFYKYNVDDFKLVNYQHHEKIDAPMNV